jgi:hypothetical protein
VIETAWVSFYMGAVSQTNQKSKAKELTPEGESLGASIRPLFTT